MAGEIPAPMDVGFSPAPTPGGNAGASGGLSSLFGTTTQQGTPNVPSKGLWAKISEYLGEMDPEEMEKELKYIQQMVGGLNKVSAASSQSQVAQRLMKEGTNAAGRQGQDGLSRPYAQIPGGPTVLPQSGPNVTPEQAASMLRTMGLR